MKKGWQSKTLGEVCEVMNGGTPKTGVPEYWDGKHLWITPAEMGKRSSPYSDDTERKITDRGLQNSSARMLPPHSVILSSRAPIGHLVINTEPMATNQGCKGLIPRTQLQHKFLYYYLSSVVDLLNSLGTGATFKELSGGKLKEVTIPVPPLAEQERIVGLLDEAFAGLATAKANAEKNLHNARALFESHLQSVFTQRGAGWVEKPLGEALVKTETTDPTRSPQTEFDYIDVSSVSKETLAIEETQRLQGKDAPSRARKLVRTNDVLFATIRPTLRRIAIVPEELDSQVCSTGYFVLRAKPDVDHRLVFYFLQTETFMTAMETLQKGASYPAVTDGDVRSQTIPIPPLKEQKKIASKLQSLREETQRLARLYERKHAALAALKKSLLHQAFTGAL